KYFLPLFTSLALSACGTTAPPSTAMLNPLLPMPDNLTPTDPGNDIFMNALEDYVHAKKGPPNTQYEFTRLDLDGDGLREGIAIMKSPHQYWCNFDGCQMAVFRANDGSFSLVSEIAPVRGPIIVSEARNNGWRDLIVRVSGQWGWDAKDVAMCFDGRTYPPTPAFQPKIVLASNAIEGLRIFP
ncbi:MAG TPA: hypothetical protein VIG74_03905, partial [Alphaproteobacteria bacterium]